MTLDLTPSPGRDGERRRILANAQRMLEEIADIRSAAEHWNRLHPDQPPIDPDPDGALRTAEADAHEVIQHLGGGDA